MTGKWTYRIDNGTERYIGSTKDLRQRLTDHWGCCKIKRGNWMIIVWRAGNDRKLERRMILGDRSGRLTNRARGGPHNLHLTH
jgi:hypothetical protein